MAGNDEVAQWYVLKQVALQVEIGWRYDQLSRLVATGWSGILNPGRGVLRLRGVTTTARIGFLGAVYCDQMAW